MHSARKSTTSSVSCRTEGNCAARLRTGHPLTDTLQLHCNRAGWLPEDGSGPVWGMYCRPRVFGGTRGGTARGVGRPATMSMSATTTPGSSRPTSPVAHRNWRNPAVYLNSVKAAGSRFLHMASGGASSSLRPKAHVEGSDGSDEDEPRGSAVALSLEPQPSQLPWVLMVGLAAVSVLICYADRSNISTAIISMAEQYDWDAGKQGVILSAFFAGYMCTQLLGGSLADKYGGKGVLAVGVTAWSLCTLFTPEAAALGVPALVAMRVAMGLGEGVAFPAIHSLIARGVPPASQSTAVAVVTAASYAGTALAFGIAPTIIEQLGWPWVFYLFGASAVVWIPFWLPLPVAQALPGGDIKAGKPLQDVGRWSRQASAVGLETIEENQEQQRLWVPGTPLSDNPDFFSPKAAAVGTPSRAAAALGSGAAAAERERERESGAGEEAEVLSEAGTEWSDGVSYGYRARAAAQQGTGFRALLRTREVWAICAAQYTGSWGFYGLLTWLPTFFKDYYHVEIAQLAGFTLWPYVVQGGVGALSGVIADRLLGRGWSVRQVRRTLQALGMLGPAACMLLAVSPLTDGSPSAASAWVTVGLGLNALTLAGVSVSHLDIAPKNAGVVFATGNTAATAAGLLAVPVTGWVLAGTGSWSLVFTITALHYAVGAALFCWWVGGEVLPQDG